MRFGEVGRELLKRRELTQRVTGGEGCVGRAGEGSAYGDRRGGVERAVTWVRAGLWPLQS